MKTEREIKEWAWIIVISLWGVMICKPIWRWAAEAVRDLLK